MEYSVFNNLILDSFDNKIGISLSDKQSHLFFDFMNLLIEKSKVMNLTAITEPDEIVLRHFVDSSMVNKFFDFGNKYLVDVGTGAGFPGIPLAISNPNAKFVLTDTLGKRINFLDEVVKSLGLKNVELFKARVEDFANDKKFREKFDFVLSRGVAKISVLAEYSLPLAKIGGKMLAYKLDDCNSELADGENAIKILGGMFHVKHSYKLIDNEPDRCILEINKLKTTPKTYPRKAGTPSKSPLV